MPKERHHLLLADLTLRRMESRTDCSPVGDRWRTAFLLGSIAPDVLFYDLPLFRLSAVGHRLHGLMEPAHAGDLPERLRSLLIERQDLPNRPWLLGMAHHFMVDFRWHPLINGYSASRGTPCRNMGLDRRSCHHWLESELEAFWLNRSGPARGYTDFLRRLRGDKYFRGPMGSAYKRLLDVLGMEHAPSAAEITRCAYLQVFLMLEFVRPVWTRLKKELLRVRGTRSIGALVLPPHPSPGASLLGPGEPRAFHLLWETEFVEATVEAIATAFLSLPGWSWLSLPRQSPRADTGPMACPTARNT